MRTHSAATLLVFLSATVLCSILPAQDWPQFRGPTGNGVVEKLEHPEKWDGNTNIAWTSPIPGGGLSSPIVVKDRIFLTTAVGTNPPVSFAEGVRDMRPKKPNTPLKFNVVCLKLADGSKIWEKTLAEQTPAHPIHASNSFATESPATDGKHIFVYFAAIGTVAAMDMDGKKIWETNIGAYPTGNGFGPGSSLAYGAGKVFLQCDNDKESFMVAFEASTGKESWRKQRSGRTSWATPLFWKNSVREEVVTCGSGFVTSYAPETGEELWTLKGIGMSFSSSPASDATNIYFGNSGPRSSGPLVAVKAGMKGQQEFNPDVKSDNVTWAVMQAGPGMSSPVAVGGYVYVPGRGMLSCYSTKDGSLVYKERLRLSSTAASMWAAGSNVFLMDENGKTMAIKVGPKLDVVATNEIKDDLFWSTPAISGKSLLIRGVNKLYCIRPKSETKTSNSVSQ